MCGRYKLSARHKDVQKHFDLIDSEFDLIPNEDICPGTNILAVDGKHRAKNIYWTIEARDSRGNLRRAINAKSETVSLVEMFKNAFRNGRVLIPATGFYEWKEGAGGTKEKYEFNVDEELFAFAGISAECNIKGEPKSCGVILTTEANDVVRPIHAKNRMPVIVHKHDYEKWLDPSTPVTELTRIMQPLPNDEIRANRVTAERDLAAPGLFDHFLPETDAMNE